MSFMGDCSVIDVTKVQLNRLPNYSTLLKLSTKKLDILRSSSLIPRSSFVTPLRGSESHGASCYGYFSPTELTSNRYNLIGLSHFPFISILHSPFLILLPETAGLSQTFPAGRATKGRRGPNKFHRQGVRHSLHPCCRKEI